MIKHYILFYKIAEWESDDSNMQLICVLNFTIDLPFKMVMNSTIKHCCNWNYVSIN